LVKVSFLEDQPAMAVEPGIIVPKAALKSQGDDTFVWTVHGGVLRKTTVVRARDVETGVEVKEGLKDGDIVVLAQDANLREGEKVSAGGGLPGKELNH
jgi:hypothetical protein